MMFGLGLDLALGSKPLSKDYIPPVSSDTVPDAPTIGAATAGVESASVTFAPNGTGGSPITEYTVTPHTAKFASFALTEGAVLLLSSQDTVVNKQNGTAGGVARSYTPMLSTGKGAVDIILTYDSGTEPIIGLIIGSDFTAFDVAMEIGVDGSGGSTDGQFPTGLGVTASGGRRRILVDRAAGKIWVGNGTAIAGSPEAGTGQAFNFTPGADVWFYYSNTGPNTSTGTLNTSYSTGSFPAWQVWGPLPASSATGASSPIEVPFLNVGQDYSFTVHATNAIGDSAESAESNVVTPTA